jgi:hypothetical protein
MFRSLLSRQTLPKGYRSLSSQVSPDTCGGDGYFRPHDGSFALSKLLGKVCISRPTSVASSRRSLNCSRRSTYEISASFYERSPSNLPRLSIMHQSSIVCEPGNLLAATATGPPISCEIFPPLSSLGHVDAREAKPASSVQHSSVHRIRGFARKS